MKKIIYTFFLFLLVANFLSSESFLEIDAEDYEIIKHKEDDSIIKMKILNDKILKKMELGEIKSLSFRLNKVSYIAKGNEIIKSSVPNDCDYFFPIDDLGNVVFFDNELFLYKIYGK